MKKGYIKYSRIYIIENIIKLVWIILILLITNFSKIQEYLDKISSKINIQDNISYIFIFIILFTFLYYYINYKRTYIKIEDGYIKIKKNIITEDATYIGFKNIASICIKKTIIGNIFKVSTIIIKCEKKSNVFFDILITGKDIVINEIIEKIGIEKIKENKNRVKFSKSNIFFHSLCMISISYIIIILNVINIIFEMIRTGKIITEISTNLLGFILTFGAILFPVLYSFFKTFMNLYNFEIADLSKYIKISHGMFTKIVNIIPKDKINGYVVKESIISKIFGKKYVKVLNSGSDLFNPYFKLYIPVFSNEKIVSAIKSMDKDIYTFGKIIYQDRKILDYIIYIFPILFILIYTFIKLVKLYVYNEYIMNLNVLNLSLVILFLTYYIGYFFKRIKVGENSICILSGIFINKEVILKYNNILITKRCDLYIKGKVILSRYVFKVTSDILNNKYNTGYVIKEVNDKITKSISYN